MRKSALSFVLIALALLIALPALFVYAYDTIDPEKSVTLTVNIDNPELIGDNVVFNLYKIAGITQYDSFPLIGDFNGYPVRIDTEDSTEWDGAAATLYGYVKYDKISPMLTAVLDKEGKLTFENSEMKPGLYLVIGDKYAIGDYIYTPQPLLVFMPNKEFENKWEYNVTVEPKVSYKKKPNDGDVVNRKVIKVWQDEGNTEKRPQTVTVHLLKDGEKFDTVVLDKYNSWRYTWRNLDASSEWYVVEERAEGYDVYTSRDGITFILTNVLSPASENSSESRDVSEPESSAPSDVSKEPDLPQTGMLWWPIPLMSISGLVLLTVGVIIRRKK